MAAKGSGKNIEETIPTVKYYGLQTAQNVTFSGSLNTVGSTLPASLVDSNIPFVINGTNNNYFGLNVYNQSTGVNASSDMVALDPDNNYVDVGFTGSTFNNATYGILDATCGYVQTSTGNLYINSGGTGSTTGNVYLATGGLSSKNFIRLQVDLNGNIVLGRAALVTTATDGFLYVTSCAGTPTGVPTAFTGRVPMVYDSTAHKIWFYDGGWKGVAVT